MRSIETWLDQCDNRLWIPTLTGKVDRSNALGYILGYTDRIFSKGKTNKEMYPLKVLCHMKDRNELPLNVLKVACAEWLFELLFPKWLEKSTVPVVYDIPSNYHDDYQIYGTVILNTVQNVNKLNQE